MSTEVVSKESVVGAILEGHAGYGANAFVHDRLFDNCKIHSSNLFNAAFVDCIFLKCILANTEFGGCQFVRCQFVGCEFTFSGFVGARFEDCVFAPARDDQWFSIKSCGFEHALFLAQSGPLSLSRARVTDSSFRYATFSGALLSEMEFVECSFGESSFVRCTIREFDLWQNSCRGMALFDSSVERLSTPFQKLLGLIGVQRLVGRSEIVLSRGHDDARGIASQEEQLAKRLAQLKAGSIESGRLLESLNLILLQARLGILPNASFPLPVIDAKPSLEEEIQRTIDKNLIESNPLFIPILDDITLSVRLLHNAGELNSDILTSLGRQVALALSKGIPDLVSTAKCVHVLNEVSQYYFTGNYGLTISHQRSDLYKELLDLFSAIRQHAYHHDVSLERLERGSTKLSLESLSTRSIFFITAILLLLGLKVEYSSGPAGPKFYVEYSLSGTFTFRPAAGDISISVPPPVKKAGEDLNPEDHAAAPLAARRVKEQLGAAAPLDGITVKLQQIPVHDQPVFKAVRDMAARPGSWSTFPRLEAQSVLAQLDPPQHNL